ncbi:VWA domain-containing protein [Methylococcus sp. EFPC2]|uniref:vWA domain-containing protein n=1 Tax=Methylococcus sp. EFPC2 TaxID=2812648 RepID=UPI0019689F21|nr:vWA domain-containing protein [Methylococcus sp. EFPC2]QSA98435.1 VWA domain-containing protein [Methylococcus sp. EFPC2]
MSLAFAAPWFLLLSALALLPWLIPAQPPLSYSSLAIIPEDRLSIWVDRGLRAVFSLALLAAALGLAGPYRGEQWIEKVGAGARIVLLVDHSASMNDNFSGAYLGGKASESKSILASRLLSEFVAQRRDDLFGVVAFSAAPIPVLPLTRDRNALQAAIRALGTRGHGVTHIAPGLAAALDYFRDQARGGSRVVVLVSDGAARMDDDTRDTIRQLFSDQQAALYWIYLRNPKSGRLDAKPANANESTTPEYFLHQYFQTLGVPYRAYEADNREDLQKAIADLGELENRPLIYRERLPRVDLTDWCYGAALACSLVLMLARTLELKSWRG